MEYQTFRYVHNLGRPLFRDMCLGKFPWLVGRYSSYLLPKQALATPLKIITKYHECPRLCTLFRCSGFLTSCLFLKFPLPPTSAEVGAYNVSCGILPLVNVFHEESPVAPDVGLVTLEPCALHLVHEPLHDPL